MRQPVGARAAIEGVVAANIARRHRHAIGMSRKTNSSSPFVNEDPRAPSALLLMLEGRAPFEYAALLAATPWLRRAERGDGHPVLVFPGMGANDLTTVPLRLYLGSLGYVTEAWGQGFNLGPRKGVLKQCAEQIRALADRHGQPVSLVGWSLGGLYAREMAKELPALARCVVTLGTPFTGHPRATNAWRIYELLSGQSTEDPALTEPLREAPPVPTTSLYSRTDGIVSWRCSIQEPGALTENIEVHSSHVGMGMNPLALYALADRLAQPIGAWQRFDVSGARRWFYPQPAAYEAGATA
jgi:pimeloyl-ACP methyl ester carboxylesterase